MPSTYSSNLRLELQATGENTSTWGVRANNDFELIEDAIAGLVNVAMGNANVTLSALNGASDQSRNMFVNFTGANTAIRVVTIPSVSKLYFIGNSTTGGFDIQVKTSSGSAVGIPASSWAVVICDGTNCTTSFSNNVSFLNGQVGSYYQNSSNQNAGTLADARLPTTMSGKTFNTQTIVSIGTGTTSADYFSLRPTDMGVGKPGIFFQKTATALQWNLNLWDGSTNSGILDVFGTLRNNGSTVWNAGNDGSGSGLDADLLDGMHAADILAAAASFPSGTRLVFQQTNAPTGWTKDTTHNNKAMRIVSGAVSSGGSVAFTTAFASQSVTGTTDGTTPTGTVGSTGLVASQIPAHTHNVTSTGSTDVQGDHSHTARSASNTSTPGGDLTRMGSGGADNGGLIGNAGAHSHNVTVSGTTDGGSGLSGAGHSHTLSMNSHSHTFTGNAINLAVQYVDFIVCQKN